MIYITVDDIYFFKQYHPCCYRIKRKFHSIPIHNVISPLPVTAEEKEKKEKKGV
jgi:hypothetical protein